MTATKVGCRSRPAREDHGLRGATRCPWCHDLVAAADDATRACRACLARVHASCWTDAGRCPTCATPSFLVPGPTDASLRPFVGAGLVGLLGLGAALGPALVTVAMVGSALDGADRHDLACGVALFAGGSLLMASTFAAVHVGWRLAR